jgi:hypothetical protein
MAARIGRSATMPYFPPGPSAIVMKMRRAETWHSSPKTVAKHLILSWHAIHGIMEGAVERCLARQEAAIRMAAQKNA